MGRESPDPVTVTIKTVPADDDPYALLIARQLSKWLRTAGINANVPPDGEREELFRQVLVNHEYDLFVGRYPDSTLDADSLYRCCTPSSPRNRAGRTPSGTPISLDDLLARQRTTDGDERHQAVADIQSTVARENPFTVLCLPRRHPRRPERPVRAIRDDQERRGAGIAPATARRRRSRHAPSDDDRRARHQQPQSAAGLGWPGRDRHRPAIRPAGPGATGRALPLARRIDDVGRGRRPEATLRPDLTFHDGEPLTADDVAFSYGFLRDTANGERNQAAPTMRYRGRSTLVESATAPDRRTVRPRVRRGRRTRSRSAR